jgi:hypothetical protein
MAVRSRGQCRLLPARHRALQSAQVEQTRSVRALRRPVQRALRGPVQRVLRRPVQRALRRPVQRVLRRPCRECSGGPCSGRSGGPCRECSGGPCRGRSGGPCRECSGGPCSGRGQWSVVSGQWSVVRAPCPPSGGLIMRRLYYASPRKSAQGRRASMAERTYGRRSGWTTDHRLPEETMLYMAGAHGGARHGVE